MHDLPHNLKKLIFKTTKNNHAISEYVLGRITGKQLLQFKRFL